MNLMDNIIGKLAKKKLGADFGERLMKILEDEPCSQEDIICEIVEHYQAIIELLSPEYSSVKLDADNLLTITIDGTEYDLDDKFTSKLRNAAEHRMAIECLISDIDDHEYIISQIEVQLNQK